MAKKERTFGELLIESAREGLAIKRGEMKPAREKKYRITARIAGVQPPPRYQADAVKNIRMHMDLSQHVFAEALNVSRDTVRAWEQGKREPDGPSRRLLQIAARSPDTFLGDVKLRKEDRVLGTALGASARAARAIAGRGARSTRGHRTGKTSGSE